MLCHEFGINRLSLGFAYFWCRDININLIPVHLFRIFIDIGSNQKLTSQFVTLNRSWWVQSHFIVRISVKFDFLHSSVCEWICELEQNLLTSGSFFFLGLFDTSHIQTALVVKRMSALKFFIDYHCNFLAQGRVCHIGRLWALYVYFEDLSALLNHLGLDFIGLTLDRR